jgi:drug/metabolite transporter (DMT)-like permease
MFIGVAPVQTEARRAGLAGLHARFALYFKRVPTSREGEMSQSLLGFVAGIVAVLFIVIFSAVCSKLGRGSQTSELGLKLQPIPVKADSNH